MKNHLLRLFFLIISFNTWAQTAPQEEWTYRYDQYYSYMGASRGYSLDNFSKGKNKLVGIGMTFYSANESEARLQGLVYFNDKGQESVSTLLNCSSRGNVTTRPTCGPSVISYKVAPTDDEGVLLISTDSVRKYSNSNKLQWKTAVASKSQRAVSAGNGTYYVLGTDGIYQLKESGQTVTTKKITVAGISSVVDIASVSSGEFLITGTLGTYRYNADGKILNSNLASQGKNIIATNNDFLIISDNSVLKLNGSLTQIGKYEISGVKTGALASDQSLALIANNALIKLKTDLTVQWNAIGNFTDVAVTVDGGVVVTGSNTISKYASDGKVKWSKTYANVLSINVFPAEDGGIFYRKFYNVDNAYVSDINKLAADGPDCSLTASITPPSSTNLCAGSSLKLTAKPASIATGTYSYQWKKDGANVGTNAVEYTATQAGKYSVVITQGSCSATSSELTLTVSSNPVVSAITGNRDEICEGTKVTLATQASGGTGTVYTYQWEKDEVDYPGATKSSFEVMTSGAYSVTAKDGNGCVSAPQHTTVTFIKPIVYITVNKTDLCSADKDSVKMSIFTAPNFKAETYSWKKGSQEISKSTGVIYVKDPATYRLEVSNSNGCVAKSNEIQTYVYPSPTANAGPGAVLTGSEIYDVKKLNLSVATGGTAPYRYQWATYPGTQLYDDEKPTFAPFSNNTNVILTIVDSKNCIARDTAFVQVNSCKLRSAISAAGGQNYVCEGNTLLLSSVVTDSLGAVQYSWREGNTVVSTSKNALINKAGSYYVSIEDSKGCRSTSNIQVISQKASPKPVINGDAAYCKGGGALLNVAVTGGQLPYKYKWELGSAPIEATTSQYNAAAPGNYYVTVTDDFGCYTKSAAKVITEKGTDLVSNITPANSLQVMEPDSVVLNATVGLGYTYLWRKDNTNIAGSNQSRLVLKGARQSGSYVVIVSRDGCSVPSQSVMVRIEAPTSVEPAVPQIIVQVAPNPTLNRAVVSVSLPQASEAQIQVYSPMGQALLSQDSPQRSTSHRFELDLSRLSSGMFIWKVQAGSHSQQGRLVKGSE